MLRTAGQSLRTYCQRNRAPAENRGRKLVMNKGTGLVLEGGAMRGLFTAGVLDVMMEKGIDRQISAAVGVSAGAVFGCNLKSRQHGRAIRYNLAFSRDWRYSSWRSLLRTGNLYGEEFCYDTLPNELDPFDSKAFAENPMKFYCVCTDLETGRPFYHLCTDGGPEDLKFFQASASMPVVSRPVEAGGRLYLDGGVSDSIPLVYMEHKGYEKNIVVLTRPLDYVKKPSSMMPVIRKAMKDYPMIAEDMEVRHLRYNRRTAYIQSREESGHVFVIRPDRALGISRVEKDPEKLLRVYHLGRKQMEEQAGELMDWLAEQS